MQELDITASKHYPSFNQQLSNNFKTSYLFKKEFKLQRYTNRISSYGAVFHEKSKMKASLKQTYLSLLDNNRLS